MQRLSATEFVRSFGKRNFDIQNEPIEVTSHGTPIGYYVNVRDYEHIFHMGKYAQSSISTYAEYVKQRKLLEAQIASLSYVSMKETVLSLSKRIRVLARKYGASRIQLFGSVARGQDNPDSDIDFLVSYKKGQFSFSKHGALLEELENLFGRKIDLIDEKSLHASLAQETLKEAITL